MSEWSQYVRDLMAAHRLSQAELARATGVAQSLVHHWLHGGSVTIDSARAVAVAFAIPLPRVLVGAGLVTAEEMGLKPSPPVDVEQAFRDVARAIVTGQMDERISLAWRVFSKSIEGGGAS